MNNNYYYGIDYKKLKLFCKIKDLPSYYQISNKLNMKFDYDKHFEVLVDYRHDEEVLIEVQSQNDEIIQLKLGYTFVEFHYFFENIEEQEKQYYEDLPF